MNSNQKYRLSILIIVFIALFIILTFIRAVITGEHLDRKVRDTVAGVMMAMIAIVSMIIGGNEK